ncbi:MAG: uridine kinase [Mogibacterium sp.]|nr:uridine kinase [Mogibacterium sp.]MBR2541184.1 uridine kinase [Mogibacterium sp.]
MSSLIIGVAGGTGSGKSTFTNRIKNEFGDKVSVIYYDNYYKAHDDIPFEERKLINYDHPDAFETDLFIKHLKELREGRPIECPVYDYTVHNRSDMTVTIKPSDVIIVEGIMVLQNEQLRDLLDIKIYVEADADERILRRVIRDVKERGRDVEGIAKQYLTTVKPMHYIYVEPTKYLADIVLNSGMNDVVFDVIKIKIESHLRNAEQQKAR